MSNEKKTSWDYQKNKYKQINIKFNMDDNRDAIIHYYLTCKTYNASKLVKDLVFEHIGEGAYLEP